MQASVDLSQLSESEVRTLAAHMQSTIQRLTTEKEYLSHEIALLRRHQFGKRSEAKGKSPQQSLLRDLVDEDLAAIEGELETLNEPATETRQRSKPRRQSLPAQLPRTEIHHDPESTTCGCGCQLTRIGEDISEKLDYEPGTFSVERHIRSKWACKQCETVVQAPVAPHIIDKGIPTTNLLAQVLISKYADHLPLYRQEQIYARAGVELPRSTLADWVGRCGVELTPLVDRLRTCLLGHAVLHADETPVPMLSPGKKKTHRAYIWAYATPELRPHPGRRLRLPAHTVGQGVSRLPGRLARSPRRAITDLRLNTFCTHQAVDAIRATILTDLPQIGMNLPLAVNRTRLQPELLDEA